MTRTILILALCAAPAFATPWDVPDGKGGWKPNPDCTGSCRDTGIPDKPKDPKPETPREPRDGDKHPKPVGYQCYGPEGAIWQHGEVEPGAKPVGACSCWDHPVGEKVKPWKGCR